MLDRFANISLAMAAFMILSLILINAAGVVEAIEVELHCIADTMFSGHSAEHNTNCGMQTWLRLKGFQGIVVFKFDMLELEGSFVETAALKVFCSAISGSVTSPFPLTDLQISTIAHDWIEGDGNAYTPTEDASTYDYPGGDLGMEWADDDQDGLGRNGVLINVEDVINGTGDSILNSQIGKTIFEVNEWTETILDAELVQSLVDGEQYGIVLWQPDWAKNLDIASRELNDGENAAILAVTATGLVVHTHDKIATTWAELKTY